MPSLPEITAGHIGLSVTDLDRSLAFYQGVLNLESCSAPTTRAGVSPFSARAGACS